VSEFTLPVPHIYPDGSVSEFEIKKREGFDWLSFGDGGESVVIANADHARRIAQALLVAASLLEK
jgi:hypothetical protein